MIYEIRISGIDEDNGRIELSRLAALAQSITDIASGALRIRLSGISSEKGRKTDRIVNAVKIHLSDLKSGSTILALECEPFSETLVGQQGDVFNSEVLDRLPHQTPIGLVIESFHAAINYKEDTKHLDKGLLKKLKNFERIFISNSESITFSNTSGVTELTLENSDFKKIKELEESIPEPQEIIVNGVLDELKYSKSRITIATPEGAINGVLSESLETEGISRYWGKSMTISGRAHYRPNGKLSFVYIEKVFEPSDADKYFSKSSKNETVEQQIARQLKNHRYSNHLNDIIGQWPGEESIEEIINDLD